MEASKKYLVIGFSTLGICVLSFVIDSALLSCLQDYKSFAVLFSFLETTVRTIREFSPLFLLLSYLLVSKGIWHHYRMTAMSKKMILFQLVLFALLYLFVVSVALASLNTTRSKGPVAQVRAYMTKAQVVAEMYYSSNRTYAGFCESEHMQTLQEEMSSHVYRKHEMLCRAPSTSIVCSDSIGAFALSGKILSSNKKEHNTYWCIDSTGFSKETEQILTGTRCD
jgi:Tfp pilus assembly protein PilE